MRRTGRSLRRFRQAVDQAKRAEDQRAKQRLDLAVRVLESWRRQGIQQVSILEVLDLLSGNGDGTMTERAGAAQPRPVHPREAERDPVTGCLPVTAPKTGLDKVAEAVEASRGGPPPPAVQGYA